ncbi:hypothetical protein B5M44_14215 [Shinella sumterensis]|nr:hypothetical protein B5M44_14215 [Shinella sumterensis]
MPKIDRISPKMSTVEFCQKALRHRIAPPSHGSVKARITAAARKLGWSVSRTKDVWYADPRVSISADELHAIETKTGVHYGREEARELEREIENATALLVAMQAGSPRTLAHALIQAARILAGAGA